MDKSFTSKQIADATCGKLNGDESINIFYLAPPAYADENMIAVAFEKDHLKDLPNSRAKVALVPEGVKLEGKTTIEVSRPKMAMGQLMYMFYNPPESFSGIHPTAIIDSTAKLGNKVSIGPFCVVGKNSVISDNTTLISNVSVGSGVTIGSDCLFYPSVSVGDRAKIGNKVILHNGVSIGADGFSFVTDKQGNIETARESGELGKNTDFSIIKVPSLGSVEIEDNVEIGANTTVDKGTLQNTIIKKNTKIDNLVMIAHNCIIGESCLLAGQVGISGSTKLGNRVILAGQVGIADHLEIGDDVIVMAKSGISKSVPSRSVWIGNPAMPLKQFNIQRKNIKSIDDLRTRLKKLELEVFEKEQVGVNNR